MKALIKTVLVLVGCISLDPVLAQPARAPSDDSSVADTVKQLAVDWAVAQKANDVNKLNQLIADDWVDGSGAKAYTKESYLSSVKSGKMKMESYEFGPADVKVFGNVAVLQGSITETMITNGKANTLHVAYMDVWVKRGDKWMVVRSQSTKL